MDNNGVREYHSCLDKVIDKLIELYHHDLTEDILKKITSETELKVIKRVLEHTQHNHTKTAKILGISRSTLLKKIKKVI